MAMVVMVVGKGTWTSPVERANVPAKIRRCLALSGRLTRQISMSRLLGRLLSTRGMSLGVVMLVGSIFASTVRALMACLMY